MKTIESIMQSRVVTVELDDTLRTVKEIFDHTRFHHLLVVDGQQRLKGLISDRDLFKAISPHIGTLAELPRDTVTLNKHVHQIMTRDPVSIQPDNTLEEAAELLLAGNISCLPVVDPLQHILGILSWKDLLSQLTPKNGPD